MKRLIRLLLIGLILIAVRAPSVLAQPETDTSVWYTVKTPDDIRLHLYFFWSLQCPHCKRALPFLDTLKSTYPWLQVHTLELTQHAANIERYIQMARALGQEARSVPAFLSCEEMIVGYATESTTGRLIERKLLTCYERLRQDAVGSTKRDDARPGVPLISVPGLGPLDPSSMSLPLMTLVIAGLDAFNPCAFFVLLFLLSLLVHAQNRWRMLLIGGTFVLCSGVMYFIFMAAWLNVFLVMGQQRPITIAAGTVALAMSLLNIKDYFGFKRGASLSIPEQAKPTLYRRVRALVHAATVPSMMLGTVMLAVMANTYELLCTAGFPMIYTRALTLQDLQPAVYYAYLLFYNTIYIIPLAVIVLLFTVTLGSRKLQENEGRRLKLLSGLMMLTLSLVLLIAPQLLDNVLTAVIVLVIALATTGLIVLLERLRTRPRKLKYRV